MNGWKRYRCHLTDKNYDELNLEPRELHAAMMLLQKLAKTGIDAVPQSGETLEQAEQTVKEHEAN